jgi:hypothetical protein
MSKRTIVVLIVIAVVGTACWLCSEPLLNAIVAMHQRG